MNRIIQLIDCFLFLTSDKSFITYIDGENHFFAQYTDYDLSGRQSAWNKELWAVVICFCSSRYMAFCLRWPSALRISTYTSEPHIPLPHYAGWPCSSVAKQRRFWKSNWITPWLDWVLLVRNSFTTFLRVRSYWKIQNTHDHLWRVSRISRSVVWCLSSIAVLFIF